MQAARPRYQVNAGEHGQLTERFFEAARSGDVTTLQALLSERATLHTAGGGKRIAARRLIYRSRENQSVLWRLGAEVDATLFSLG